MPASGTTDNAAVGWKSADKTTVKIGGSEQADIFCSVIEESVGVTPGRAILRYCPSTNSVGPNTLNRRTFPWKTGSRVTVTLSGVSTVLFNGAIARRLDNGGKDAVMWECWDDRWLLAHCLHQGALVRDPYDGEVKHITRYVPRMNPEGKWNCTGALVNGKLYPVFTAVAEMGKVYEAPNETFTDELRVGFLTAWTPRRALQYHHLLTTLKFGDVPGLPEKAWRSLANSTRLKWDASSLNIKGADPAEGHDPLDRKMPDVSFRGERLLGSIVKTLNVAGTHGLCLQFDMDESRVAFYPKGLSGLQSAESGENDISISLIRGGNADDLDSAYDFQLDEDGTEVSESVLVHGAPVHVESALTKDNIKAHIAPAWTSAEETCFKQIIDGELSSGIRYAKYPAKEGTTTVDTLANGQTVNGVVRPLVYARTEQAVLLARQAFPHVYKAFYVDSTAVEQAGILNGVGNAFNNAAKYPVLNVPRPVLPEQSQFFIKGNERLLNKYPVRIRVKLPGDAENKWTDTIFNNGLRMTDNGWVWLDGMAEDADNTFNCVYSGSLYTSPLGCSMKHLQLNCAIPLDHRVSAYAEVARGESNFDESLIDELGGPPITYVDSPDAYHEEHQKNSSPSPFMQNVSQSAPNADGGAGADVPSAHVSAPLNRYLPPGSERPHAQYAADRKLFGTRYIRRRSTWSMVGIRPDYRVGTWIAKIKVKNGPDGDTDYDINAPIEALTHDFINQTTIVGGLLSHVSRNAAPAAPGKAPKKPAAVIEDE